jgi:hypothetical protein
MTSALRSIRRTSFALVAVVGAAVTLAAVAVLPAGAQTSTSAVTTTTVPAENPGSTAAGIVFFGVSGVIVVGALLLYLRNRRPRPPAG